MKVTKALASISLACLILSGALPAWADTVVITYRSGNVQTITMDERIEEVKDIGFSKQPHAVPEKGAGLPGKQPAEGAVWRKPEADGIGRDARKSAGEKQGVTIKWAPPVAE